MSRLVNHQSPPEEVGTVIPKLPSVPELCGPIDIEEKKGGKLLASGGLVLRTDPDEDNSGRSHNGEREAEKLDDFAATSLMDKLTSNVEVKKLAEVRRQFLKGFIGDKLQEGLPRCPIECMFWDWIYSFYPDNEISSGRFVGFTREFVTFLIDSRRFAEEYTVWIQQNQDSLVRIVSTQKKLNVTPYDVKMYADMFKQIIREKLHCVDKHKVTFGEYALFTANGQAPKLPDELISAHVCGTLCNRFAVGHLITFQHREFLRSNFSRFFADRWLCKRPETEIHKPIGKANTHPAISRLKLVTKSRIEEILKTRLPKNCARCGEKTQVQITAVVEELAGVIAQALDKAHAANNVVVAPNLFK